MNSNVASIIYCIYIYSRAYTLQDMKRREKACLQKHAQSSRTSYPKGRASLTTSAPVKKKKWEGRKCQRLLWEWKGDQGGEGFQSRKRKRRTRPPAPFQILRRRYSRSVVPKPASYPSNHQRKEGDIFLDRSWQRSKNGYPMFVQLCATTTLTGTKIHKSCVIV